MKPQLFIAFLLLVSCKGNETTSSSIQGWWTLTEVRVEGGQADKIAGNQEMLAFSEDRYYDYWIRSDTVKLDALAPDTIIIDTTAKAYDYIMNGDTVNRMETYYTPVHLMSEHDTLEKRDTILRHAYYKQPMIIKKLSKTEMTFCYENATDVDFVYKKLDLDRAIYNQKTLKVALLKYLKEMKGRVPL